MDIGFPHAEIKRYTTTGTSAANRAVHQQGLSWFSTLTVLWFQLQSLSFSTDGLHYLLMKLLNQRMPIRSRATALQPFWVLLVEFLENENLSN